MMRVRGWDRTLRDEIERHRALPFAWGESDCFTFAMDCVAAVTGVDPSADARGWMTEVAAKRALLDRGFSSVADALASAFEEIHPALAGRGDLVCFAHDGAVSAGVCLGPVLAGKGENGLVIVPRAVAKRAFRVG